MPAHVAACLNTSFLLASCVSPQNLPNLNQILKQASGQNGRACIRHSDIRGYGVLENNLISIDGRHRYFLATVRPGCNDLHTSIGTVFSGNFNEICGGSVDQVVTGQSCCTIGHIFEFADREKAFAMYSSVMEQREAMQSAAEQSR